MAVVQVLDRPVLGAAIVAVLTNPLAVSRPSWTHQPRPQPRLDLHHAPSTLYLGYLCCVHGSMSSNELAPSFAPFFGMVSATGPDVDVDVDDDDGLIANSTQSGIAFAVSSQPAVWLSF